MADHLPITWQHHLVTTPSQTFSRSESFFLLLTIRDPRQSGHWITIIDGDPPPTTSAVTQLNQQAWWPDLIIEPSTVHNQSNSQSDRLQHRQSPSIQPEYHYHDWRWQRAEP